MGEKNNNPNVIVTGGAGFVGSHVARALAKSGFIPITFDNMSRGFEEAVKWGPLIEADLTDSAALEGALNKYSPVGVIHLAAFAYVHESVKHPLLYFRNNVGGTEHLLTAMCRAGVDKIVFSSTCSIYGIVDSETIDENCQPAPINPYAQSKWTVEQMLRAVEVAHGIRSVRLRYFNAAGADPGGEIGENHDPETHLIPLVLQVAASQQGHVAIFGDDYPTADGTAVRDYIHVSDLADAHVLSLRHLLEGGEGFAANLANGRGYSVREVIHTACQVTRREIPFRIAARRPGDPPRLVGNASFARRHLDWHPKRSDLGQQISDAWRWLNREEFER